MHSVDNLIPLRFRQPYADPLNFEDAAIVLASFFNHVYEEPEWAAKLNGAFSDRKHCQEAVEKGGNENGSLLACINECSQTGGGGPLFMHRELQVQPSGGFPRELADDLSLLEISPFS